MSRHRPLIGLSREGAICTPASSTGSNTFCKRLVSILKGQCQWRRRRTPVKAHSRSRIGAQYLTGQDHIYNRHHSRLMALTMGIVANYVTPKRLASDEISALIQSILGVSATIDDP